MASSSPNPAEGHGKQQQQQQQGLGMKRKPSSTIWTASPLANSNTKDQASDTVLSVLPKELSSAGGGGGGGASHCRIASQDRSPRLYKPHLLAQSSQCGLAAPPALDVERDLSTYSDVKHRSSIIPTALNMSSAELEDELDPPDCQVISESESEDGCHREAGADQIQANGNHEAQRQPPMTALPNSQEYGINGVRRIQSTDSMSNLEDGAKRQQSWLSLRNRVENGRLSNLRKDDGNASTGLLRVGSGPMSHSGSISGSENGVGVTNVGGTNSNTSNLAKTLLSERAGAASSPNSPRPHLSPVFGSGRTTPDGRRRMDPSKSFSRILEQDLFGTDDIQIIDRLTPCSLQLEDQQYISFGALLKELAACGVQRLVTVYVRHYLTEEAMTEYKKSVHYMELCNEHTLPYHLLILGTCPPLFIPSFLSKAGLTNVGKGPLPAAYDSSKHVSVLSDPEKDLYAQLSALKINDVISPTFSKAAAALNNQQNKSGSRSSGRLSKSNSAANLIALKSSSNSGSQNQSPTTVSAERELPKQITETFKSATRLSDPVSRGRGRLIPLFLIIDLTQMDVVAFDMDINDKFKS